MSVELWKEVVGLVANSVLLITAVVAALGVARWSKEHKGRKRIDLAEGVLAAAYEAREAISFMRGPFSWGNESNDLVQDPAESDERFRIRKTYSVAYFRYQQHAELFSKLRTLCFQVEASFGKVFGKPIRRLLEAPHEVINAGSSLARSLSNTYYASEEQRIAQFEFQQKLEGIFWEFGRADDTLSPELDEALEAIESLTQYVTSNEGDAPGQVDYPKTPKLPPKIASEDSAGR